MAQEQNPSHKLSFININQGRIFKYDKSRFRKILEHDYLMSKKPNQIHHPSNFGRRMCVLSTLK